MVLEPVARSVPSTVMQSRACERELCWFIWVPKVILFLRAVPRILKKKIGGSEQVILGWRVNPDLKAAPPS